MECLTRQRHVIDMSARGVDSPLAGLHAVLAECDGGIRDLQTRR
jgi:hypothetical protein